MDNPDVHTTTARTRPPAWMVPYYQRGAAQSLGSLNLGSPISAMEGGEFARQGLPGLGAAQQNYADLMGGEFLYGGPGFNAALGAAERDILPRVQSQFGLAGRSGSGLAQAAAAQELGDVFAGMYGDERNRQMQGLGLAPSMEALGYNVFQRSQQPLDDYVRRIGAMGRLAGEESESSQPIYSDDLGNALGLGLTGIGLIDSLFGAGTTGDFVRDVFGLEPGTQGAAAGSGGGGLPVPPGGGTALDAATGGDLSGLLGGAGSFFDFAPGIGSALGSGIGSVGLGASGVGNTAALAGAPASFFDFAGGLAPGALESFGGAVGGAAGTGGTVGAAAGSGAPASGGILSNLGINPLSAGILGGVAAPFAIQALFGSDNPMFESAQERLATAARNGTPIQVGNTWYTPSRQQPRPDGGFVVKDQPGLILQPQTDGSIVVQRMLGPGIETYDFISGGGTNQAYNERVNRRIEQQAP